MDDLTIPEFLRVENRQPLTVEQQMRMDAFMAQDLGGKIKKHRRSKFNPWGKPKGMPVEEWIAHNKQMERVKRKLERAKRKLRAAGRAR